MEPIGKSPIPVPLLISGKIAMLFCWLFFLVKSAITNDIGHYQKIIVALTETERIMKEIDKVGSF